jgi:hypothetical protein
MTPGIAYALMVFLSLDARAHPEPSWHGTRAECEAHAAVRVWHYETQGRAVAWVACQRVRLPAAQRGVTFEPRMETR